MRPDDDDMYVINPSAPPYHHAPNSPPPYNTSSSYRLSPNVRRDLDYANDMLDEAERSHLISETTADVIRNAEKLIDTKITYDGKVAKIEKTADNLIDMVDEELTDQMKRVKNKKSKLYRTMRCCRNDLLIIKSLIGFIALLTGTIAAVLHVTEYLRDRPTIAAAAVTDTNDLAFDETSIGNDTMVNNNNTAVAYGNDTATTNNNINSTDDQPPPSGVMLSAYWGEDVENATEIVKSRNRNNPHKHKKHPKNKHKNKLPKESDDGTESDDVYGGDGIPLRYPAQKYGPYNQQQIADINGHMRRSQVH